MTGFVDRYHAAGLARNPFAARQLGEPSTIAFVSRGFADPPPPGSSTLVQLIGESGFGKSTQVEQWRGQTPGPYHYIPRQPYRSRWHSPPVGGIVYGDEIDRMPRPLRWRWFRRLAAAGSTVVIGTHVDLSRVGRRAGFDVITHQLEPLTRNALHEMIDLRLDTAGLDPTERSIRFSRADIDHVFAESGGIPGQADVICHQVLAAKLRHL